MTRRRRSGDLVLSLPETFQEPHDPPEQTHTPRPLRGPRPLGGSPAVTPPPHPDVPATPACCRDASGRFLSLSSGASALKAFQLFLVLANPRAPFKQPPSRKPPESLQWDQSLSPPMPLGPCTPFLCWHDPRTVPLLPRLLRRTGAPWRGGDLPRALLCVLMVFNHRL